MKNIATPFTDVYTQLLDSFRAMIPGAGPAAAPAVVEKKTEIVAKQEWEDEGGSLKKVPPAKTKGAPKLRAKRTRPASKKSSTSRKSSPKRARARR